MLTLMLSWLDTRLTKKREWVKQEMHFIKASAGFGHKGAKTKGCVGGLTVEIALRVRE